MIRTLAIKPDILLLDEPFSALDYQTRLTVSDDVYKIIEMEILMGLPVWRFLKLSDYQMNLFENNYDVYIMLIYSVVFVVWWRLVGCDGVFLCLFSA